MARNTGLGSWKLNMILTASVYTACIFSESFILLLNWYGSLNVVLFYSFMSYTRYSKSSNSTDQSCRDSLTSYSSPDRKMPFKVSIPLSALYFGYGKKTWKNTQEGVPVSPERGFFWPPSFHILVAYILCCLCIHTSNNPFWYHRYAS